MNQEELLRIQGVNEQKAVSDSGPARVGEKGEWGDAGDEGEGEDESTKGDDSSEDTLPDESLKSEVLLREELRIANEFISRHRRTIAEVEAYTNTQSQTNTCSTKYCYPVSLSHRPTHPSCMCILTRPHTHTQTHTHTHTHTHKQNYAYRCKRS
jgi:hypothetical protein